MILPFYEHHTKLILGFTSDQLNFPPHLHDCPELVRIRAGVLKVNMNTREYLLSEGELAIIFPNVIHSYQTESPAEDTIIDLLICGQDSNNGFPRKFTGSSPVEPVKPLSSLHPDIDYIFSALLAEIGKSQNEPIINAYFQIFWLRLLPKLAVTDSVKPAVSDVTNTLILYITEHFCEPLSLELLSKELGVCRFYLSRIFTKVLHIGFHEYVNALRVNHAKKMLLGSQDNILDIAMQCGFQSQQTFNRVFKENCGMTPAAYRRQEHDAAK